MRSRALHPAAPQPARSHGLPAVLQRRSKAHVHPAAPQPARSLGLPAVLQRRNEAPFHPATPQPVRDRGMHVHLAALRGPSHPVPNTFEPFRNACAYCLSPSVQGLTAFRYRQRELFGAVASEIEAAFAARAQKERQWTCTPSGRTGRVAFRLAARGCPSYLWSEGVSTGHIRKMQKIRLKVCVYLDTFT